MLERVGRDGRGRAMDFVPEGAEKPIATPALIHISTTKFPSAPAPIQIGGENGDALLIEDGGTWFHPVDVKGAFTLKPVQPTATGTVQLGEIGPELKIWHEAGGWVSNPTRTAEKLVEARTLAGEASLLYGPGLANPTNYALWVYLGIDLFDTKAMQVAAMRGKALTRDGERTSEQLKVFFGRDFDHAALFALSLEEARLELANVRLAIQERRLRALAEQRSLSTPWAVEWLRRMDQQHRYHEEQTPTHRTEQLACMGFDSLYGPEVERFRARIRDRYLPPASPDILVLLPCSQTKPYIVSPTHRYLVRAIEASGIRARVHEVMITSPLGIVPRELEEIYPANAYDVPVTGHWNRDEEAIIKHQLAALLDAKEYKHVIAHVGTGTYTFIRDLLPDNTHHTSQKRPAGIEDCAKLTETLKQIAAEDPRQFGFKQRAMDDALGTLSFQFGQDLAKKLTEGGSVVGKPPHRKILDKEGEQIGIQHAGRSFYSLSEKGARILMAEGKYRVRIQDFQIRKTSTLFAVGVESADPEVRDGDEVVVVHGDDFRGIGVAAMNASELGAIKRGVAVKVRR